MIFLSFGAVKAADKTLNTFPGSNAAALRDYTAKLLTVSLALATN